MCVKELQVTLMCVCVHVMCERVARGRGVCVCVWQCCVLEFVC